MNKHTLRPLVLLALVTGCGAPWSESSQHLSIEASSYWDGSLRIEADAADLTPEQRRLAAALDAESSGGTCGADLPSIQLRIADRDGSTSTWGANPERCEGADPLVRYAAARALVDSFGCLTASTTRMSHRTRDDATAIAPSKACRHGVFAGYPADELWLAVDVASDGRYRIEATECERVGVTLALFTEASAAPLATGAPSAAGTCGLLEQDLTAGRYFVRLAKGATEAAGDYYLRVTPIAG